MKNARVVLAVVLAWVVVAGCHANKARAPEEAPRWTTTDPTDPFFAITYDQSGFGRTSEPGLGEDEIDRLLPPEAPIGDLMAQNRIQQPLPQDLRGQPSGLPGSRDPVQPVRTAGPAGTAVLDPTAETGPARFSLVYPSPEYGILKLDKIMPKEVDLSVPFKYSIVVTNLTNAPLANIMLAETLASTFKLKGSVPMAQQSGNQLVWRIDSLGPKASETVEISGIPSNLDTLQHSTAITYGVAAASNIKVVQSALELTRKVPTEALLGEPIPVEYTVTNAGSGTAQDVKIVEGLPTGVTTTDGQSEVQIDVGALRSGQSRTFPAYLKATRVGTLVSKARVISSSNAQAESSSTPIAIRRPVLAVTRTSPERIYLGRPVTYEISVANRGDGPANDTVLEDTLPMGVTDIQSSPEAEVMGTKLTWTLGTIAANSAKSVRVSYTPTAPGILTSSLTANARAAETASATSRTAIVGIPTLRMDIVDLEDPVEVGGTVTYVITAMNDGSATDHNVRIVCDLEDKLQYVSGSGSSQASLAGRTLAFAPLRSLGPTEKASWRVVAKALRAADIRFRVTLTSDSLSRPIEETEATFLYE